MDEARAITEFLESLRPLAIRLFQAGVEAERERIADLLHVARVPRVAEPQNPEVSSYGAVGKQVSSALVGLSAKYPQGADAEAVHGACPGLTLMQVRSALKMLHNTGEAVRVDRGRYLPAQSSAGAETGGVAPPGPSQPTSQSTEPRNGPKGNGVP